MPDEENSRESGKRNEENCATGSIESQRQFKKRDGNQRKQEERAEQQAAGLEIHRVLTFASGRNPLKNVGKYGRGGAQGLLVPIQLTPFDFASTLPSFTSVDDGIAQLRSG